MNINTQVNLGGLIMKNPVTVASGTFASGYEYSNFIDISRLGAVTTKGVSLNEWSGNPTPRIAETPSGMLNTIGLQNPGVKNFIKKDLTWLNKKNVDIIVNVLGHTVEEYGQVIEALEQSNVPDAYEINVSCPNVNCGGMSLGTDINLVSSVVSLCRNKTNKPIIVKLTPNVSDIASIAQSAEDAGADAISLINTVLGMAIDPYTKKPLLSRIVGGLSGPAIKPIALRCVWQCFNKIKIPILGMGGIVNGIDAIEFMLAGATAIAVGTANFIDPYASIKVIEEMYTYCTKMKVYDINELIGALEC